MIFTDAKDVGAEAVKLLRANGKHVISVAHADVHEPLDADDTWTIDAANPDHYRYLMRALGENEIGKVVHLWSLDAEFDETRSAADLEAVQETGVLSVMALMQGLSAELSQVPKVFVRSRSARQRGRPGCAAGRGDRRGRCRGPGGVPGRQPVRRQACRKHRPHSAVPGAHA